MKIFFSSALLILVVDIKKISVSCVFNKKQKILVFFCLIFCVDFAAQSSPQELEVGPRSVPYLPVRAKMSPIVNKYLCPISVVNKIKQVDKSK